MNDNQPTINKQEFIRLIFSDISSNDGVKATDGKIVAHVDTLMPLIDILIKQQAMQTEHDDIVPDVSILLKALLVEQGLKLSRQIADAVKLVDKLFDYILNEKHLRSGIKDLIGHLRVPFFKLALTDHALFIEAVHPARLFLNEMTKVGLLWSPKDPKTFMIKDQIEKVIEQVISACPTQDINLLFNQAEVQFNQFSSGLIKRAEIFAKRVKEAEEGKAIAESAKSWAKESLQQITIKKDIPLFILNIFQQAWEHVIFLDHLKSIKAHHNVEEEESTLTAKQLIVSVQPTNSEEAYNKLVELQPLTIANLRKGFEKTTLAHVEVEKFIQELTDYQATVLSQSKQDASSIGSDDIIRLKPKAAFELESSQPEVESEPEISIAEMTLEQWTLTSFDKLPNDPQNTAKKSVNSGQSTEEIRKDNTALIEQLEENNWLEINQSGKPVLAKFASYIDKIDKYIFIGCSGTKVADYSSELLVEAIKTGEIKFLDPSPAFDKAFNKLASEAVEQHLKKQHEQRRLAQLEQERLKNELIEAEKQEKLKRELELAEKRAKENAEKRLKALELEKIKQAEIKAKQEAELKSIREKQEQHVIQNITHLALGTWVEFELNNELKKCRLAAKIASSGKFIFVDRAGIKVVECLENELKEMYQSGKLKLKQKNDLFDDALASVISNMRVQKSEKN